MKKHKNNIFIIFISFFMLMFIIVLSVGIQRDKKMESKIRLQNKQILEEKQEFLNAKLSENKWYNKKAIFLGDSITAGQDPENNYENMVGYRYTDILKENFEFSQVINYGIGGTMISGNHENSFVNRYSNMTNNADLIGIFGGTNDFYNNVAMGSIEDNDNTYFKCAFNNLLKGIIDKYPNKTIFVITPMHRNDNSPDEIPNKQGLTLKNYVDAEVEIANLYGIPVLNLYDNFELNPNNENDKKLYIPDGLHPNKEGMKILSNKITEFIKNL